MLLPAIQSSGTVLLCIGHIYKLPTITCAHLQYLGIEMCVTAIVLPEEGAISLYMVLERNGLLCSPVCFFLP